LRVATGDHNFGVRILALDASNGSASILIGGCGHGAGIQYDY
jgi:hypothetical protein